MAIRRSYSQYILTFVTMLVPAFLCSAACAQEKPAQRLDMAKMEQMSKAFFDRKIGGVFSPIEEWQCLDGSYFDLWKSTGPSVVFFGFATCSGCREGLPIFAELCLDKKYSKYNFIYVTFDDSATVYDEMKDFNPAAVSNMKKVHMSGPYIKSSGLAQGFPTIYFLNADKTVKLIYAFGEKIDCRLNSKQCWETMLDSIVN